MICVDPTTGATTIMRLGHWLIWIWGGLGVGGGMAGGVALALVAWYRFGLGVVGLVVLAPRALVPLRRWVSCTVARASPSSLIG